MYKKWSSAFYKHIKFIIAHAYINTIYASIYMYACMYVYGNICMRVCTCVETTNVHVCDQSDIANLCIIKAFYMMIDDDDDDDYDDVMIMMMIIVRAFCCYPTGAVPGAGADDGADA